MIKRKMVTTLTFCFILIIVLSSVTTAFATMSQTNNNENIFEDNVLSEKAKATTPQVDNTQRVFDRAGILSNEEEANLTQYIRQAEETYQQAFVIVTEDDTQHKTSREYADDFYDYNDFGYGNSKNGALFLIDMDNREVYISTTGSMITYYTDKRIEVALDYIEPFMQNGEYGKACTTFIDQTIIFLENGARTGGTYLREMISAPVIIGSAIFIGILVAVIVCWVIASRYSIKAQKYSYPLHEKSAVQLTRKEDVFLYTRTTSHRINTGSSGGRMGGGGGSRHTGSSGRSHGGGGRSF